MAQRLKAGYVAALEGLINELQGVEGISTLTTEQDDEQDDMEQGQSYIYARVSTSEQNVEQQVSHLKTLSPNAIVYKEHCSGKSLDREEFNKLKKAVRKGDRITVLSVSRLGRNTVEVLQFIEDMKARGVAVCVADLGGIDVCSPMGKLVLTTLAAVAEMQREEILDKQRIGIERAKAEGKYKGKQQSAKTVRNCEAALKDIAMGLSKEKAAKANGVGIATLYRYIKESKQTGQNGHQQHVNSNQGEY
ncbi:recombinase family protein [Photobacterium damselae]